MSCDTAVTSVPVLTITGVMAKDTGIAGFAFRNGPVRDVATGIKLFVFTFFLICITAPVDVVAGPWNEKVGAGMVEEEEEVEVEVVLKPNPIVVTPSFLSVTEDGTLLEEEVEELDDDDEELSSLSSVYEEQTEEHKKINQQKEHTFEMMNMGKEAIKVNKIK